LETSLWVSFSLSFIAGVATFVSPCLLPLIPAYISFITGQTSDQTEKTRSLLKIVSLAFCFVLGFSLVFSAMGASATLLGKLLLQYRNVLRLAGGFLVILFGLHLTGVWRIRQFYQEKRFRLPAPGGPVRAFLIGMVFALGWTPCVGPILSSILVLASTEKTVWRGVSLLVVYSLGLGLPFLVTALLIDRVTAVIKRFARHYRTVEVVSGIILIVTGVLIMTNRLSMLIPGL